MVDSPAFTASIMTVESAFESPVTGVSNEHSTGIDERLMGEIEGGLFCIEGEDTGMRVLTS